MQAQSEKQRRKADSTKSNLEGSKDDDEDDEDEEDKGISIDPKTYCKLGHFHLLLEDYTKGKQTISLVKSVLTKNKFVKMKRK